MIEIRRPNVRQWTRPELEREGERLAREDDEAAARRCIATTGRTIAELWDPRRLPTENLVKRPSARTRDALKIITPGELWIALRQCAHSYADSETTRRDVQRLKAKAADAHREHREFVRIALAKIGGPERAMTYEYIEQDLRSIAARAAYEYRRAQDHSRLVSKSVTKKDAGRRARARRALAKTLGWSLAAVDDLIAASDGDWSDRPCSAVTDVDRALD